MLKPALTAISSGYLKLLRLARKAKRTLAGAIAVSAVAATAWLAMEPFAEGEEPAPAAAAGAFPVQPSEAARTQHSRVAVIVLENKE